MRVFRHFRLHEEDGAAAAVYSVSLNPDGSLLATCGGDKLVRLWSTQLFQSNDDEPAKHLVQSLSKHVKVVTCCAWSSNCLLYTSPSPRDMRRSRMPSSA